MTAAPLTEAPLAQLRDQKDPSRKASDQKSERRISKIVITAWIMSALGTALWLYGYFAPGNRSLINWHANTPWWIADFLPNIESEIGMTLVILGMVPLYWPPRS
jgi:hypothetical protein